MKNSKKVSLILVSSLIFFPILGQNAGGAISVGAYSFPVAPGNYIIWNATALQAGTATPAWDVGDWTNITITGGGSFFGGYSINGTLGIRNSSTGEWVESIPNEPIFKVNTSGGFQIGWNFDIGYPFIVPLPFNITFAGLALHHLDPNMYNAPLIVNEHTFNITTINGFWTYVEFNETNGIITKLMYDQFSMSFTLEYLSHNFSTNGDPGEYLVPFGSEYLIFMGVSVAVMVYVVRRKTRLKKLTE